MFGDRVHRRGGEWGLDGDVPSQLRGEVDGGSREANVAGQEQEVVVGEPLGNILADALPWPCTREELY